MLVFLLSFLSFSLPIPFYHSHTIQVIPKNLFDRYKKAFNNYKREERNVEYALLGSPLREYYVDMNGMDPDAAESMMAELKDSLDTESTYDFAYDANTLNDCLSRVPSNAALLSITLCSNFTGFVDFGRLSHEVRVEIETNLDEDLENDILAFNDSVDNNRANLISIDYIKSNKPPPRSNSIQYRNKQLKRPKIYIKDDEKVDFNILGGDFSSKISKFSWDYRINFNISNSDFIVNQIDSFDFPTNGKYKLKSKGIVVPVREGSIDNLISLYEPKTVYYHIESSYDDTTIEFNNDSWNISFNDENQAYLQKQGSIKELGLCFNIEDIDRVNLFLPNVSEIAGDIKFDIQHDEDYYRIYYYYKSRGVEYYDEYDSTGLGDLDELVESIFFHHFPDYDSKLLSHNKHFISSKKINNRLYKKHFKSYLFEDHNQQLKTEFKIESTGAWDQVKVLPNITFIKPNHITVNKTNLQSNVSWNDHIYEESNDYPSNDNKKKKGKKSSSNKNDDDDDVSTKQSPYTLTNFSIHDVYVGASTILDFPVGFKVMQKARQTFGRFIPAPNFLHTAVWVGPYASHNKTLGAVLVYGKYSSKFDDNTYLSKDGARSYVMPLQDFIEYFDYCNVKKLEPQRNLHLFDLINEVKKSGNWNIAKYHWPTNNCQHFTATCIKILKSVRQNPDQNDWTNFPHSIYNAMKANEIQQIKV